MTEFEVYPSNKSSIAYLNGLRKSIRVDPIYQRQGEVWTRAKQQRLIDSILNGFDIPKIYLHLHPSWKEEGRERFKYSLVDGRQRLEAIWDFLDGNFSLASDFKMLGNGSTAAAGHTYSELVSELPELATEFGATNLDIMMIRTDDIELIEEMFSRLNEAVPLNAPEKRNGRGGPLRSAVRSLAEMPFFTQKLPFTNNRYRHFDLATKFLLWAEHGGATDTKKRELDAFWDNAKTDPNGEAKSTASRQRVSGILDQMTLTFESPDRLLSSIGMVSVYFLLYMELIDNNEPVPLRSDLEAFQAIRTAERPPDEETLRPGQRRLLEFDRLAQSPNDQKALTFRVSALKDFLRDKAAFN